MAAYSTHLLQLLNEQRLKNHGCDLTLVSKDQQQFSAHRFLLAASSPYMSETLLSPGVTQVLMDDIDGLTLQVMLDAVYTGELKLPEEFDKETEVDRIKELGRVFGIQVLVDLCEKYGSGGEQADVDLKAGGDNALTASTEGSGSAAVAEDDVVKPFPKKRGRKPKSSVKKDPSDEEEYTFKKVKRPKLERGPDGKFHRPDHELEDQDSNTYDGVVKGDEADPEMGNDDDGDVDYKPRTTRTKNRSPSLRYLHAGKHKWSKKPTLKEITDEMDRLRAAGTTVDSSSDEEGGRDSDVSIDVAEGEPDQQIQQEILNTFHNVLETINKQKLCKSEELVDIETEENAKLQPQTDGDLQDWKSCLYCSQFRGKKKGRYDFHMSFCKIAKYKCEQCGKPFLNERDKSEHKCKKMLDQVICDICGKVLRDIQSMKLHMDVHNNVKKYPCPHCGKMFRRTTQRQAHIVHVHTKERPHVCASCGARFGLKYELNRHVQRHSEYPTFACSHCDKFFYERSKLSFHVKHHHDQKSTQQEQTIFAITNAAMNSNEVEIEVHTTPQDLEAQKKVGEILGYINIPVSTDSGQPHVHTLTAIDQLTQAASNAQQQDYIHLTPVSYEGQNYYVYQQ